MAIEMVKCRAEVSLGGITVRTPYVLSFNVNKSRSNFSTFNASLKVSHDEIGGGFVGSMVTINAGVAGNLNTIFTGYIKKSTISPCYDDPKYVLLNVNGEDALSLLQGKSYTRRSRATKGTWVTIDSVVTPGLKSGKFKYVTEPTIIVSPDEPSKVNYVSTSDITKIGEMPPNTALEKQEVAIIAKKVESELIGTEGQ